MRWVVVACITLSACSGGVVQSTTSSPDPLVICQGVGGVFHTDQYTAIKEGMGALCRVDIANGTTTVPRPRLP